jgi:hypothetical protein
MLASKNIFSYLILTPYLLLSSSCGQVWDVVDRGKRKKKTTSLKIANAPSLPEDAEEPVLDAEWVDVYKGGAAIARICGARAEFHGGSRGDWNKTVHLPCRRPTPGRPLGVGCPQGVSW